MRPCSRPAAPAKGTISSPVPDVFDTYFQTLIRQILYVGARHRRVKKRFVVLLFGDEYEAGQFLLAMLIPHEDLHHVLVELGTGILAGDLEFICAGRFGI